MPAWGRKKSIAARPDVGAIIPNQACQKQQRVLCLSFSMALHNGSQTDYPEKGRIEEEIIIITKPCATFDRPVTSLLGLYTECHTQNGGKLSNSLVDGQTWPCLAVA